MTHTLSPRLLESLVCPQTRQKLLPVTGDDLQPYRTEAGESLATLSPQGVFLTEDHTLAYPVENHFPVLKSSDALRIHRD